MKALNYVVIVKQLQIENIAEKSSKTKKAKSETEEN